LSIGGGEDTIGVLQEKNGDVWQIEKKQITFENRIVYDSLVSE